MSNEGLNTVGTKPESERTWCVKVLFVKPWLPVWQERFPESKYLFTLQIHLRILFSYNVTL